MTVFAPGFVVAPMGVSVGAAAPVAVAVLLWLVVVVCGWNSGLASNSLGMTVRIGMKVG